MAILLALSAPQGRAQDAPQADEAPQTQTLSFSDPLLIELTKPESTLDQRRAAVTQLLDNQRFDELSAVIERGEPTALTAILLVITEPGATTPDPLVEPILAKITSSGAGADPLLVRALAPIRTKPAITRVMEVLAIEGAPKRLLTESTRTLRGQTGREDLGDDPRNWLAWWEEARWLPPREWEAMLAVAQAERARRLAREAEQQAARIIDLHRQIYALTPQDQRSALLAKMMNDQETGVRALAFELSERALLNTQRLDDQVRLAAIDRLGDNTPSIRAAAASLLFRLGAGAEATEAVRRAIRRESDPVAAAAMLEFLRRRPNETDLIICLDWLGDQEPGASAAARTLANSAASGGLSRPKLRNQALAALRSTSPANMTPGKIELWGVLGGVEDRDQLATMLRSSADPAIRRAIAGALVRWPGSVPIIASASGQDPQLFPLLADAVALHEPTAAGYRILSNVPGIDPENRATRLTRLRRSMPPGEMLATIGAAESRADAIESVVFDPDLRDLLRRDPRLMLTQALIRARFDEGDDQGVVQLASQLPAGALDLCGPETIRLSRRSMICLGRFEDPSIELADVSDWRAAEARLLERGTETAAVVSSELARRFPDSAEAASENGSGAGRDAAADRPTSRGAGSGNQDQPGGTLEEVLTLEPGEGPGTRKND